MAVIMFVVLVLTFGVVMPLAQRSRRRRREERLQQVATSLGVGPPVDVAVPWGTEPLRGVEFPWQGVRAAFVYEAWGRYELGWVMLRDASLPRIYARRETAIDRVGKRLGLNREVQTGDPDFDAKVYLETDESDALVQRAMGSPAMRLAVGALVAGAQPYVRLGPGAIAQRLGSDWGPVPKPDELAQALRALSTVAVAAPRIDPADLPAPSRGRGDVAATAAVAAFAVALFGVYVLPIGYADYRSPLRGEDQDVVAKAMLLVWFALVPATWWWVRGHSRSFRNFLTVVLLSWIPLLTLGPGAIFLANAIFDRGPTTTHEVAILRRRVTSRKVDHRHLYVRWWDAPHDEVDLEVSAATFRGIHTGDLVTVRARPGAFGWPWAESIALRRAAPSVRLTARVRAVTGPAPVTVGAACAFRVSRRPTRAGYECQTELRCGGSRLYGSDTRGFFACTFDDDPPLVTGGDPTTSRGDQNPAMSIDTREGTMAVWDDTPRGAWHVDLDVGPAR